MTAGGTALGAASKQTFVTVAATDYGEPTEVCLRLLCEPEPSRKRRAHALLVRVFN